jgi:hypothetical protein
MRRIVSTLVFLALAVILLTGDGQFCRQRHRTEQGAAEAEAARPLE